MFPVTVSLIFAFAVHLSLGWEPEDRLKGWTVKITFEKEVVCAGVLLNSKFFLTSSECFMEKKLEKYTVIVGDREVRQISYILKSPDGDDVITGRLSSRVSMSQRDISRIFRIANEAQMIKATQNSREHYVTGIDDEGDDLLPKVNVMPDNKCDGDFTRDVNLCLSKRSSDDDLCALVPGSPVVINLSRSWILLGLTSKSCTDEQSNALKVVRHRQWINKIKRLTLDSLCKFDGECGEKKKCRKNMCVCTYCYEEVDGKCEASNKKVLILGAGMAGITAAKTLGENGCSNVRILEGSDRIGGRIKSVNVSGYKMELGAQWVCGLGSNPMAALAAEYGLSLIEEFDTWVVRDKSGTDLTAKADNDWENLRNILKKVDKFARKMDENDDPDITAEALLRKFGWNPDNNVAEVVEVYELDTESAREMPSVSGKYMNHLRVFEEHGNDQWMFVNDPRGYSYIIEEMARNFEYGQRILTNKKVTSIENWNDENDQVEVFTDDGSVYKADDVIITFSLGVLQSKQVNFEPPLSERKLMAIDKFGFGHYLIMYFKFETAFWDNISTLVYASERHGDSSVWYNMNTIFPGCNILQHTLMGFEADAAERMEEAEIIEQKLNVLRSMYPATNITEPELFVKSDWLPDPLTKGCFSYWTPAFRREDMEYLGRSEGKLHFAGEHLNLLNHGFVHSAYTSGKQTAKTLADTFRF